MTKKIKLYVILDDKSYEKIKTFSVKNDISQAEIVRVLIDKSSINLKVRDKKTIQNDAKIKKLTNTNVVDVTLAKELKDKIKDIILKNKTSYSEVVRTLINNTKLKPSMFRTTNEIFSKAKSKKK
jgi:hypothetical protein